jgi:hypothetical protein
MEAVTVKEMISSPIRIASSEAHTANGNGNGNGNGSSSAIRKKALGEAPKRARYLSDCSSLSIGSCEAPLTGSYQLKPYDL